MLYKRRPLTLAVLALLVVGAVVVSSASAANYTANSYPVTVTGESAKGNDTFITEAGKVECKVHYQGTLTASSTILAVTPTYTNCQAFGFLSMSVDMGSCDYRFNSATTPVSDVSSSKVDLVCNSGGITIKAPESSPICTSVIDPQTGLSKVKTINNTAAGDVSVQAEITGIAYTVTQDGFGCTFNGTGSKTGAEYKQDSAITFDATGSQVIDVG